MTSLSANRFMLIVGVAGVAAMLLGFFFIDSPRLSRLHELDAQRETNLAVIENNVRLYFNDYGKVPLSLDDLPMAGTPTHDPQTDNRYEYTPLNDSSYRLCAVFAAASTNETHMQDCCMNQGANFRKHTEGRNCFTTTLPPHPIKSPRAN